MTIDRDGTDDDINEPECYICKSFKSSSSTSTAVVDTDEIRIPRNHFVIGLSLSDSCKASIMVNNTKCASTKTLVDSFDNTIQEKSGKFIWSDYDNDVHRTAPQYKNHHNIYQNEGIDTILAVDPDAIWEKCCMDVKIIIEPSNFLYSDIKTVDTGQWSGDMQILDKAYYKEQANKALKEQQRYEDGKIVKPEIVDTIRPTMNSATIIADNKVKVSFSERILASSVAISDFDLMSPPGRKITSLTISGSDIILTVAPVFTQGTTSAVVKLISPVYDLEDNAAIVPVTTLKTTSSSNAILWSNNIYIEGCSFARVASNMTLVTQVINYFWNHCEGEPPSIPTYIEIPPVPIDYNQHRWYNYTKWVDSEAMRCKTRC